MNAQKKPTLGYLVLHGHYTPYGHEGREFTFYHDGRFESKTKGNELEKQVLGKGIYKIEAKKLTLDFEQMSIPGELIVEVEIPHSETYKIHFESDNQFEVTQFRINLKGPRRLDPRWKRKKGFFPYQLGRKKTDQE
ncbi:MAG TPA: hypothetical protein ENJ82_08445 [Bacteroidetes bacterium]|nr:hypothetical protein [Bacteroidota bacterium]